MYNYHIGEYIKRKREEKEIKQDELCYGICDRSTLSRIERGKQEPSYYILKALLQRLGISEDRCQILMGPQEFEISELQREIVADNVREDFSSALKKIRRLEELSQSAVNPILWQFVLRVRALAGYEKIGERYAYTHPVQRKILIRPARESPWKTWTASCSGRMKQKSSTRLRLPTRKRETADRRLKFTVSSSDMCRAILPAAKLDK